MFEPDEPTYRCPGEPYSISRAVHLGRLAQFYPKCRDCPHRLETGTLPQSRLSRWGSTRPLERANAPFDPHGIAGVYPHELSPSLVWQVAAAFGLTLIRAQGTARTRPTVVVGNDGRALAPELVVAAIEGLRFSGCHVIDVGGVTAGALVFGLSELHADGGLLVGNRTGQPQTASVRFWDARGCVQEQGTGLDAIREAFVQGVDRPTRRWGSLKRRDVGNSYLDALSPLYHALRPLRVVIDTSSRPLVDAATRLTQPVACRIVPCRALPERPPVAERSSAGTSLADEQAWRSGRLSAVAAQTRHEAAHFGLWVDGDGDACELLDERGERVPPAARRALLAHEPDAEIPPRHAALGDDALAVLTRLLVVLSQSDRPLSEVVSRVEAGAAKG